MRLDLSYFFKSSSSSPAEMNPSNSSAVRSPEDPSPKSNRGSPSKVPLSKAAFLCVKEGVGQDLESLEELKSALQHAGYNPNHQFLQRYWTENTSVVTYSEFQYILQTEPLPRKLDLLSYFRKLDPSGTIEPDHFLQAMTNTAKGKAEQQHDHNPLPPLEFIQSLVRDPKFVDNVGRFDYVKFVDEMFDTSAQLVQLSKEMVAEGEDNLAVNSKTYKIKRKTPSPSKSPEKVNWKSLYRMKGAFYFEGEAIISHQYNFKVHSQGRFEIAIEPDESNPIDCQLYLFKLADDVGDSNAKVKTKGSPDTKVKLTARSPMILMPKSQFPSQVLERNRTWCGLLEPGTYLLIPSTTGCRLKKRKCQPESDISLVSGKGETVQLTDHFKQILTEIFHQVDLDGNGRLSRTEFNLFNWRTSGEEVQDEEWDVVRENFSLESNELTLSGFLQLHQMEAEDNGGDSAELWITLNAMGYNSTLTQDEASVFEVTVRSEKDENVKLNISGLKSGGSLLDKATIRCIMQECKVPKKVDKSKDVVIYREDSPTYSSFVIENRSREHAKLTMDFSRSKNVLINHPHLVFETGLSPKSTLFVAHLIPRDVLEDKAVDLKVSFVNPT